MKSRMTSSPAAKRAALALIFALLPSALTACASTATTATPGVTPLKVVASTSVWGSVIEAIGGDKVRVTSLVNNPSQDPHSFQASVRDQAAVNSANLVFLTGNGYDNFMNQLVSASHQPRSHVIALAPNDKTVKPLEGQTVDDPHVWYDFAIVGRAANTITERLSKSDPSHTESFNEGNRVFQLQLAKLTTRLQGVTRYVKNCSPGMAQSNSPTCIFVDKTTILQPESVGLRLLKNFAVDATPPLVRIAAQNEADFSVEDMAIMKAEIQGEVVNGQTGFGPYADAPVRWLVLNDQQTSVQIEQLKTWVRQSLNTQILSFSETLPVGKTYFGWMSDNIKQIEDLRAKEVSF